MLCILVACGGPPFKECSKSYWESQRQNYITFKCDTLTYKNHGCIVSGKYIKTYDNFFIWDIEENTCNEILSDQDCYFAISATNEHGNLRCDGLGIAEAFYRYDP